MVLQLIFPPPPIFHALWERCFELDSTYLVFLITAISVHISLSPPNPPIKFDECCDEPKKTNTLFERFVQSITFCSKSMIWLATFCETYVRLSGHLFLNDPSFRNHTIHPCIVLGGVLTLLAAVLRIWCFKTLGPFFTFEITIRPKHELITTGPYAWVRHPSYTGVYLTLTGATLVFGSPTTWISQHAAKTPLGAFIVGFWLLKCSFAFRGMILRLRAEDQILREIFGEEWDAYAYRVPCKFVPKVI